ncbi:hypothetical protein [Caballeronia sp. LjRoot31]|uniref:hypothetical protein n=1 Tax=Caballeronia sp. LjRoot31 TaxID=3342324 RepID=UPI003ECC49D8
MLARYLHGLLDRFVMGFRWGKQGRKHGSKRDQAILVTAAMLGAVIIARAGDDPELSDEIRITNEVGRRSSHRRCRGTQLASGKLTK